ncbi:MAG: transcription termination factor NusA [Limisphaerales bacterium]
MNNELIAVLEFWEREKGISKAVLLGAVQDAMVSAAKKAVGPARELRCEINAKTGDIQAWAKLVVAERVISKHDQLSVFDARRLKPDAVVGDEVEVEVTPTGFGRIASQYAKQALMQQIRKAEKQLILDEFKDRVGDIVSGVVRRFERSDVTIDLGRYEALLPNRERVPTEEYQVGERLRAYVKAVETTAHGPEIILSRSAPEFVLKLFQLEVAEIADGTIEVRAIAREPGFRTKMAVFSKDSKVDPVGACVGLRGQRVKNIVRELNNEKVDIIPWSADIRTFVTAALNPVKPKSVTVNNETHRLLIMVPADQLSLAIGKRGQNARLTARLTGWQVDIDAEAVAPTDFESKVALAVQTMAAIPGITAEQADLLVHHGFLGVESLVQADVADLAEIPEIGEQAVALIEAAKAEAQRRSDVLTPPAAD